MNTEIESLQEAYYKAANALISYGRTHGFLPGAKVRALYRDDPPRFGVIADFGHRWEATSHGEVPVILDGGCCQRWSMANLEVLSAEQATESV